MLILKICIHIVSEKNLGIPQNSRDFFEALHSNSIINDTLNKNMKAMIGFRNIEVYVYKALNMKIIQAIIDNHLKDFNDYVYCINKLL